MNNSGKSDVINLVKKLDECKKKTIAEKLGVSSSDEIVDKLLELSNRRVFILFRSEIKTFEGINYIHIFPELKAASVVLTPEKLLQILLDDEVDKIEVVPEIKFT